MPTGFIDSAFFDRPARRRLVLVGAAVHKQDSFAMNVAQHAAVKAGATVAVFSLEMPASRSPCACCVPRRASICRPCATARSTTTADAPTMALGPGRGQRTWTTRREYARAAFARCRRLMAERGLI